jgi:hypothetical protein
MASIHELHTYYDEDERKDYALVPVEEYEIESTERKQQQREYFERKRAMETDTRRYVNCYHDAVTELNEILDVNEMGAIMKLIPHLKMHSGGQLVFESKRMSRTEIRKVIGKGDRWTRDILKTLVDAQVLIEAKDGRRKVYNVSDRYHTIGYTLKDRYYTKLYQTKTRADINDITIQAAGVLYKMLPYFHYARYYLCENPNEPNPERLHHLTQTRLAELVNVERSIVKRGISELSRYGFVMISKSFGATVIMVNPDVMYRKKSTDDYTDTVRYQFAQTKEKAENGEDFDWLPY